MNTYLIKIEHYFHGFEEFEVNATCKEDALFVARQYVERDPHFSIGGNYKKNTIQVVKKLNKKKGE